MFAESKITTIFVRIKHKQPVMNTSKVTISIEQTHSFTLEVLREYVTEEDNNTRYIVLSGTKRNLMSFDGMTVKPAKIEIRQSGKCRLWYHTPKGRSFSQGMFSVQVRVEETDER